jgi:DNA-directed RNA polymerase specialized sigma subunit
MFNNFVDNLLLKNDKEVVIALFKQGSTPQEIAHELNISQNWVEEITEGFEIEFINDLNSELVHND